MRTKILPIAISAAMVVLAGCSSSSTPSASKLNQRIDGTWQLSSGFGVPKDARTRGQFVTLLSDGSGTSYSKYAATDLLNCQQLHYSVVNDTEVFVTPFDVYSDIQSGNSYRYKLSGDTLTVTNSSGEDSVYTKAAEVSSDYQCKTFTGLTELPGVNGFASAFTNIGYANGKIWFVDSDAHLQQYNLSTQQLDTPFGTMGTTQMPGPQGSNFWFGSSYTLYLKNTSGTTLDQIDVLPLQSDFVSMNAAAYDGTYLWVGVYNYSYGKEELFKIDVAPVTNVLLSRSDLDMSISNMTYDGTYLWAVNDQTITKIDPATSKVVATYTNPDETMYWYGIASDQTSIYLLGKLISDHVTTKLVKVTP